MLLVALACAAAPAPRDVAAEDTGTREVPHDHTTNTYLYPPPPPRQPAARGAAAVVVLAAAAAVVEAAAAVTLAAAAAAVGARRLAGGPTTRAGSVLSACSDFTTLRRDDPTLEMARSIGKSLRGRMTGVAEAAGAPHYGQHVLEVPAAHPYDQKAYGAAEQSYDQQHLAYSAQCLHVAYSAQALPVGTPDNGPSFAAVGAQLSDDV